jgi:hypothetical protein
MSKALKGFRRHKLLLIVGILLIAVVVGLLFYMPSSDKEVASGVLQVSGSTASNSFNYNGTSVNQNMTGTCSIPASIRINCQNIASQGSVRILINDEAYATGTISGTGAVELSSSCGCSTVCICKINVGNNNVTFATTDFKGQLEYKIYVKS